MSYNNGSNGRDYRGRGKKAAGEHRGKHYKPSADDELVPIGNTAVEARVARHEKQPAAPEERDPFAPSDDYVPTPEPVVASAPASIPAPADADAPASASAAQPQEDAAPAPASAPAPDSAPQQPASAPASNAEAAKYSRADERYTKHKTKFSRGQKIAVAVVAVVAAIVFAGAGVALAFWNQTQQAIELPDQTIEEELTPTPSNEEPYWVLIMGSDSRSTDTSGTRSDVIMLMRVDEPNKQVTLVSIPRDSYVQINGTYDKINAAYSYGGAKQMIRTVQEFSGIKVSHYAEIYFQGFSELVDQIGGVDVDVPETGSYNGITIKKGKQHLNGEEALTFARIRKSYATGDFRRTECQRLLVQALAKKILSQDVTEIPNTISAASKCFSTDMSLQSIMGIAVYMKGMDTDDMYSAMAPSTTGMINGVSYTFTYDYQWILMMQKAANGENPKLAKKEQAICGTDSTQYLPLDMEAGLPVEIQTQLQDYWDKKAAKAAQASASSSSAAASAEGSESTAGSDSSN